MISSRMRNERGEYTVEFALIVVFLASLFFLVVQAGLIKYTIEALNYAARQGAIAGGTTGQDGFAAGAARSQAEKIPFIKNIKVDIRTNGDQLMLVTIGAEVPLLFNIPILNEVISAKKVEGMGAYLIEKKKT